jgi:hypothetical protein
MRILGYVEHPRLKITIFKNDDKLSVKLESGLYEQTYKFRSETNLETADDARRIIDADFMDAVEKNLQQMHTLKMDALMRNNTVEENEFDEII